MSEYSDTVKLNIYESFNNGEITAEEKDYLLEQLNDQETVDNSNTYYEAKLQIYEAYEAGQITAEEKEAYITYLEAEDGKPTKKEIEEFFDRLADNFDDYKDDIDDLKEKLTGGSKKGKSDDSDSDDDSSDDSDSDDSSDDSDGEETKEFVESEVARVLDDLYQI